MPVCSQEAVKSLSTLTEPVENPALVTAIAAASHRLTEATQKTLFDQLNHTDFLVVFQDEGLTEGADTRLTVAAQSGEDRSKLTDLAPNGVIQLLSCADSEGRHLLPVFTDWAEIEAFSRQSLVGLVMPSCPLWLSVLNGPYDGVVVNPARAPMLLSREQVRDLHQRLLPERHSPPVIFPPLEPAVPAGRSRKLRPSPLIFSFLIFTFCLLVFACSFYRFSVLKVFAGLGALASINLVLDLGSLRRHQSLSARSETGTKNER